MQVKFALAATGHTFGASCALLTVVDSGARGAISGHIGKHAHRLRRLCGTPALSSCLSGGLCYAYCVNAPKVWVPTSCPTLLYSIRGRQHMAPAVPKLVWTGITPRPAGWAGVRRVLYGMRLRIWRDRRRVSQS